METQAESVARLNILATSHSLRSSNLQLGTFSSIQNWVLSEPCEQTSEQFSKADPTQV